MSSSLRIDKVCVRRFISYFAITINSVLFSHSVSAQSGIEPLVVTYPSVNDPVQREFDNYYLAQLQLALDKAGVNYQMVPFEIPPIAESRSEYNLKNNRYNVHWLHTSVKRELELIPIRVPLFKGLTGWRIFFIPSQKQSTFSNIQTVDQLRSMIAGQGHDWPDTEILRANNFRVMTSPLWSNLFQMLNAGRFDYFPRSIIEIWREQNSFKDLNIKIEKTLALRYPTAYYLFVSKHEAELASAINRGMNIAVKDGSFDKNFNKYLGQYLRKANLNNRRIYYLDNPLAEFPSDPDLWYMPERHK